MYIEFKEIEKCNVRREKKASNRHKTGIFV